MFTFDKTDLQRIAVSSLGAIALTTAFVGAAVAPARAATPVSAAQWQARVERQIEARDDHFSTNMASGKAQEAVVAVRFTAAGDYAGAGIARSSGDDALDAHAVQVASQIRYPQMPSSMRGQPQTIAMRLVFGRADTAAQYADMTQSIDRNVRLADAGRAVDNQVAAK